MKTLSSILVGCSLTFGGWVAYANLLRGQVFRPAGWQAYAHLPFDSSRIDAQIAVSERAVNLDPGAAMGWSQLSSDYMARSRESDDLATAVKAEAAARRSLRIRVLGNIGARNKLISSLLQQHRFKDALSESEAALLGNTYDDQTVRLKSECLIEIGRYTEARAIIGSHPRAFAGASGEAIDARLLDLEGKPEAAVQEMMRATREADNAPAMPSDAIGWFHTHTAIQMAKMGRHDEARAEYCKGLALYPRDYKAMAGLAKLAFQDGRWQEAIDWGTRSDAIAQMADVRALVGDAYAKLGNATMADEQYGRVAALVGRPSGMNDGLHEVTPAAGTHGHRLDRQYALFCADHGRDPDGAYAAALRDFEGRQDIYAYDTLAWVCHRTGRADEAVKGIKKALALGTQDPILFYHASEIYASAHEDAKAVTFLLKALEMDPRFDGVAAPRAIQQLFALVATHRP